MNFVPAKRMRLKWVLAFLFWTFIGLSFASQFYLSSLKIGHPVSWTQAIGWSLGDWYVWALMSVPIVGLARRFHLEGPDWRRNLAIHLGASVVFSLLYVIVRSWIGQVQSIWIGASIGFAEAFKPLFFKTFYLNVVIYWVIASVTHAVNYYRQFRERELRTAELERSLTQAKLKTLQMQLNPHFLFNTLHAISALIHKDVEAADRMIMHLSDLLRSALETSETHEVPLRQELDFLDRYLEIECTRFGPRLRVRKEVAPDTLEALVPKLCLQPLVENAIQHGIEPYSKPGEIDIQARRSGSELVLRVMDNGGGLPAEWREGVGLSNTRFRLEQLYERRFRFDLTERQSGGLEVTLALPFRPQGGFAEPSAENQGPARIGDDNRRQVLERQ